MHTPHPPQYLELLSHHLGEHVEGIVHLEERGGAAISSETITLHGKLIYDSPSSLHFKIQVDEINDESIRQLPGYPVMFSFNGANEGILAGNMEPEGAPFVYRISDACRVNFLG